jgi:hypothetical protein
MIFLCFFPMPFGKKHLPGKPSIFNRRASEPGLPKEWGLDVFIFGCLDIFLICGHAFLRKT